MKPFLSFSILLPGLLAAQQPNILLIMADDVDVEAFQAYATHPVNTADGGAIATPNIDALAREGLQFTNAFTTPLCTPTRVMLLTGQSNRRNYRAFGYLDNDQTTFAQVLRANGYTTAIAGKWQLSDPDGDTAITPSGTIAPNITPAVMRNDYGFDSYLLWQLNYTTTVKGSRYWHPKLETASADGLSSVLVSTGPEDYGPDLFTQHLKAFMTEAAAANKPFLAYYAMALPHDPWVSTPHTPGATSGDNEVYFDDNVAYIDKLVGELVAHLDDPDGKPGTNDSIRENTLIIFTSDNGTSPRITVNNAERGNVTGDKGIASYDGTHVPFILDWGNRTPASVESRMVNLSDVFPTILEITGIIPAPELAEVLDGQPIIGATGAILDNKPAAYIWYDPKGRDFPPAESAQNQNYKLYRDGRLYHIAIDKLETINLNVGNLNSEEQDNYEALLSVLTAWDPPVPESDPLAPDDAHVSGNLLLWLKDAVNTYSDGAWTDSSGNARHVRDLTGLAGYGGSFGVETATPSTGAFAGKPIDAVRLDDNHIMGATALKDGTGFTDLTILTVYQASENGGPTRPVGIGSRAVEGNLNLYDHFNLAADASIRYDDGFNAGSFNHPTHLVVRATRLSAGATVSDWINTGTGLSLNINEAIVGSGSSGTSAPSFHTKNDNFYIGEISAQVGGTDMTSAIYHIVQVAVYDTALPLEQIAAITGWMATLPEGNPSHAEAWRLAWFGQIENSGDAADASDFDSDGLNNLHERAFGSDPTTESITDILPQLHQVDAAGDAGSDYLAVSYRQLAGGSGLPGDGYTAEGITYTVEYNDNLLDPWSSGNITVLDLVSNGDGTETAHVRLNDPVTGRQFLRLRVMAQ